MARPTKLDETRVKNIVELIRAGNYSETAAQAAGISPATFYNWMNEGREARNKKNKLNAREKSCLEFLEAVEKARGEAEARAVAIVTRAAMDGTWQAAAWYLERTQPDRYGRRQRVEVDAKVETTKTPAEMTDAELDAFLANKGLGNV